MEKVKQENMRRSGTHSRAPLVDTKGKLQSARTFIHNKKIASAQKKPPKLWKHESRGMNEESEDARSSI